MPVKYCQGLSTRSRPNRRYTGGSTTACGLCTNSGPGIRTNQTKDKASCHRYPCCTDESSRGQSRKIRRR